MSKADIAGRLRAATNAALGVDWDDLPIDASQPKLARKEHFGLSQEVLRDFAAALTEGAGEALQPAEQPDADLKAEVERLTKEVANLQARLTARAKSMLKLRNALSEVHDNIEDEGDRAYFGSTNDADTFKDVWQDLDAWHWDDIMEDGKLTDVYEVSRQAHIKLAAAEAEADRLCKRIEALEAGLRKRADWHKCSCPEPCDDYGVFPGGCAGRYAADYRALLSTKPGGDANAD